MDCQPNAPPPPILLVLGAGLGAGDATATRVMQSLGALAMVARLSGENTSE